MAQLSMESTLACEATYAYGEGTLDVTLADGKRYRYYQVPGTVWRALRKAATSPGGSAGRYLSRNVMGGQYRHRKLKPLTA